MLVSGFMVPYDKVLKCTPSSTVKEVIEKMVEHSVSSLVIVPDDEVDSKRPSGIVTKTDLCQCYLHGISLTAQVGDIMPWTWTKSLEFIKANVDRDAAAKFFEKHRVHHAVVVNEKEEAVGLISSADIASEVAKDARAWPWNRNESGRVVLEMH
ncbi:hypothetical protein ACHAXS_010087 [Conticribra weissflogii]